MKTTKNNSYLHDYYCSRHGKASLTRIILSKSGQPEQKAPKNKKGLHALGSN